MSDHGLLTRARELATQLAEGSSHNEKQRQLPQAVADTLAQKGFYRMLVPRALRGFEAHPTIMAQVLCELARHDSAAAWCAMTGATTGVLSAYLPRATAEMIWAENPQVLVAGVLAPFGKATAIDGGYRLSGRWPFMSGGRNAQWLTGGGLVMTPDGPRKRKQQTEIRSFFFTRDEVTFHDTWDVMGLCGSGSHDAEVEQIIVPEAHSACIFVDSPLHDGALYRFPSFGLLAIGVAAVALGVARAAIDDFVQLATTKRARSARRGLAELDMVQIDVARAEAAQQASRAALHDAIDQAWQQAKDGDVSLRQRALLRIALCHVVRGCRDAVDTMYQRGGGSSLYTKSPLQRHFRDLHTLTQHVMVGSGIEHTAGRVLLGIDCDGAQL